MDISSFVLLGHQQALRRRLDVVANNMANVGTIGFKREQPLFQETVRRSDGDVAADARNVAFVLDYGATHDTRAGGFQATGNPLDVMVEGSGYLSVQLPDGATAYTRAGSLKVLENGRLGTGGGRPVLGEGGQPIQVPPEALGRLTIADDGTVSAAGEPVGRIAVTFFDDEGSVEPRGDGLMNGSRGRLLGAAETKLKSGGLESSNVQPIVETTHMIEILRSYQSSMRLADTLNDMRKRAIERLGRIGN